MTKALLFKLISITTVILIVAVFSLMPTKNTYAQGGGVLQQSAATGTAFTYQGSLAKSGSGVTDTCNFSFGLFDASSGGSQIGSSVAKNNVSVNDGKFAVDLDFGSSAFNGDARYLDIQVQCTGDASMQQLAPRTVLNGTPYALTALDLIPGVNVSDSYTSGRIFGATNTATTGNGAALFGEAHSNNGAGVSGINLSADAGGNGVYGGSDKGVGVYGNTSATSGPTWGVYGKSSSSGGTGVYGTAPWYGVHGKADGVLGVGYGVYGETDAVNGYGVYGESTATSGATWGVYGTSSSSGGKGVSGIAPLYGVYGKSSGVLGVGYGIYGETDAVGGYGVYSNGDAHVEGTLTWKVITSTISIPPAAFTPSTEGYGFDNDGHTLTIGTNTPNVQYWLAPVQLPQGATATKLTFYWTNDSASVNGAVTLYRTDLTGSEVLMAATSTSVSAGPTSSSANINSGQATIDNTQYNYYIYLLLRQESGAVKLHGVTIEYTVSQPY